MSNSIKRKGQGQIFKSAFLERFTKVKMPVAVTFYLLIIIGFVTANVYFGLTNLKTGIFLYLGGLLFWSFGEYVLHRWVFHTLEESERFQKIGYALHGVHHEYPNDTERLFMPPLPGLIIVSIIFGIYFLILGNYSVAFTAGFVNGYLFYSFIHYSTHAVRRPIKFLRPLWHNHLLHHYKYPEKGYGVTSNLWDHVFRTMPPAEDRYGARERKAAESANAG